MFGAIVEKYYNLEDFFKSTISEYDLNYIKMQDNEEDECSFTNWLESSKFHSIISTIDSQKLIEISSTFESDDENGKIQFLTSFAKLQTLAEREKIKILKSKLHLFTVKKVSKKRLLTKKTATNMGLWQAGADGSN